MTASTEPTESGKEDEKALVEVVRADYGEEPTEVRLLRDGQAGNRTYLLRSDGQKSILRVYGGYWRDRQDWIDFELALLVFLSRHEVPVSTPVPRLDGRWRGELKNPNGPQHVARFTFVEGTMEWPMSEPKSRALGAALARLHRAADAFPPQRSVREYDVARLIERSLERIRLYLSDSVPEQRDAWDALVALGKRIAVLLNSIGTRQGEYGVIHGDIHQGNAHFGADGQPTLFDFSLCGIGWRTYDLTGFLWPLRDETIQEEAYRRSCDAFLSGYQSERPLSPAELDAIPAFVKLRDYWETGDWLECRQPDADTVTQGVVDLVRRFRAFPLP